MSLVVAVSTKIRSYFSNQSYLALFHDPELRQKTKLAQFLGRRLVNALRSELFAYFKNTFLILEFFHETPILEGRDSSFSPEFCKFVRIKVLFYIEGFIA